VADETAEEVDLRGYTEHENGMPKRHPVLFSFECWKAARGIGKVEMIE